MNKSSSSYADTQPFSADDLAVIDRFGAEDVRATYPVKLRRILEANRNTEIGRRFGFDEILDAGDDLFIATFKQRIPVSDYAFWKEYIDRIVAGERNVTSTKIPAAILTTGGTSGASKRVPLFLTTEMLAVNGGLFKGVQATNAASRTMNLVLPYSRKHVARSPEGLPMTGFSSLHGRELGGIPSELPEFIDDVGDIYTMQFVKSLFFLRNGSIESIRSTYVNILVSWFNFIQNHWDRLLDTLDRSRIDASDTPKLTQSQRDELDALLDVEPARMEELRRIDSRDGNGLIQRIWPRLVEASSCHAGPYFVSYEQVARRFLGSVPLRNKRLASNEMGIFGLGLSNKLFILDTAMCNFFEFIEESFWDSANPPTVDDFEKLEVGRRYDIVMTTDHSGLYRLRQRDIIRILGKAKNGLPVFSYEGRIGASLSIGNTKILDANFAEAIDHLRSRWSNDTLSHFIVRRDERSIPNRFVFYLESSHPDSIDSNLATEAAGILDGYLCASNYSYQLYRMQDAVGHVAVSVVEPGTVDGFQVVKAGAVAWSINQVKCMPTLSDPDHVAYFDRRTIATSRPS